MQRVDAVVTGCVERLLVDSRGDIDVTAKFNVKKSIKGTLKGPITIKAQMNGAACGVGHVFTEAISSWSLLTVALSSDPNHRGVYFASSCGQIEGITGVRKNNFDGDDEQCAH